MDRIGDDGQHGGADFGNGNYSWKCHSIASNDSSDANDKEECPGVDVRSNGDFLEHIFVGLAKGDC